MSAFMELIEKLKREKISWERKEISEVECQISYFYSNNPISLRNVVFDSLNGKQLDSWLEF